jgi:hypothetical protein
MFISQPLPPVWNQYHDHCAVGTWWILTIKEIPIIHSVLDITVVLKGLEEQISQKVIVWRLLEAKFADVVEIDAELLREAFAEFTNRSSLLLLSDLLVLLLVCRGLETLPGQTTAKEVHEDVSEGLEVVSS